MFVMGIMISLLLIGAASSVFTRGDLRLTANLRDATHALYLAEAGLAWTLNRLRGESAALYFGDEETLSSGPMALGEGTFSVEVAARDSSGVRQVIATGAHAGIERAIRARLRRFRLDQATPVECMRPGDADSDSTCDEKIGVFGYRGVWIRAGSTIDSFHGDSATYGAGTAKTHGNVVTNGDLTLEGSGTALRGTAWVGRGLFAGTNTIERERVVAPTVHLPPLPGFAAVCASNTNPSLVDCDPPFGTITAVLAGSPPDQTLTVANGQVICMPPGIYCFRQIVVQTGGRLRIVDAGTGEPGDTTIHLGTPAGAPALKVQGRIEHGPGMKPNLLRVFARGDVEIFGWSGAQLYGLFYLPRSQARLNMNTGGNRMDFHGAIYADQVTLGGGPVNFHVDEDAVFGDFCANGADPTCKPAFVIRDEWVEERG